MIPRPKELSNELVESILAEKPIPVDTEYDDEDALISETPQRTDAEQIDFLINKYLAKLADEGSKKQVIEDNSINPSLKIEINKLRE